jgi:hypothetical protein
MLNLLIAYLRNHKYYFLLALIIIEVPILFWAKVANIHYQDHSNSINLAMILGLLISFMMFAPYKYQAAPLFPSLSIKLYKIAIIRTLTPIIYIILLILSDLIIELNLNIHFFRNLNIASIFIVSSLVIWTLLTLYYDRIDIIKLRKNFQTFNWKTILLILGGTLLGNFIPVAINALNINFNSLSNPILVPIIIIVYIPITVYSFTRRSKYIYHNISYWGLK